MTFIHIDYMRLNSRQKENYNFQKVAARLANYGFNCVRISDDWQGADFIACHINGQDFMKVQLMSRPYIDGKYEGKDIFVAYMTGDDCYVYPHDAVLAQVEAGRRIKQTRSWQAHCGYSWPGILKWMQPILDPYEL